MTHKLFGCLTLLCLCLSTFAYDSAAADTMPPFDADQLPDSFTVSVGDYNMTIDKATDFTIRSLIYKGNSVLIPSGWMQPVLNVDGEGEAQWIGTGHGGEVVTSLELTQDGVTLPLSAAQDSYVGGHDTVMRVIKTSIMGPYTHRSVLELSAEGLTQSYYFEVIGDCSEVNFLYALMLIYPKEAESYRLVLTDGELVEGTLPASDKHVRLAGHASISSLSMYFTQAGIVATLVPQEAYPTREDRGNFFVVRRGDNKFYTQVIPPKKMGTAFEYHTTMRCAEATEQTFPAVAEELVQQIVASNGAGGEDAFTQWLSTVFTPAELESGAFIQPEATPRNDSISNLMRAALGMTFEQGVEALPQVSFDGQSLKLTYRQLRGGLGPVGVDYEFEGITYRVEVNTTLGADGWDWGNDVVEQQEEPIAIDDKVELVTVSAKPGISETDTLFMRLKILYDGN